MINANNHFDTSIILTLHIDNNIKVTAIDGIITLYVNSIYVDAKNILPDSIPPLNYLYVYAWDKLLPVANTNLKEVKLINFILDLLSASLSQAYSPLVNPASYLSYRTTLQLSYISSVIPFRMPSNQISHKPSLKLCYMPSNKPS